MIQRAEMQPLRAIFFPSRHTYQDRSSIHTGSSTENDIIMGKVIKIQEQKEQPRVSNDASHRAA